MAKPENQFIAGVHRYLPPKKQLHHEGMANPYRGGTADCWYSGRGKGSQDLWIEWKFVPRVPTRAAVDLLKDYLSELQAEWCRDRFEEGRNVWVGVGCPAGGFFLCSPGKWETPISADEFKAALITRRQLADQIVGFTCPGVIS